MEQAFLDGAGFSANAVSILIRTLLLGLFTLWTARSIYLQFGLVRKDRLELGEWIFNTITMVFMLAGMIFIVM